jgi:hypothetical protein
MEKFEKIINRLIPVFLSLGICIGWFSSFMYIITLDKSDIWFTRLAFALILTGLLGIYNNTKPKE